MRIVHFCRRSFCFLYLTHRSDLFPVILMCRMSALLAIGNDAIEIGQMQKQLDHLKVMALGNNTIPFAYGHFTDSEDYDPEQKLVHGDAFGTYVHTPDGYEAVKKYQRAVFTVGKKGLIKILPSELDVSLMHARLVTAGSKDEANTQPFALDAIVGMHNGTVSGLQQGNNSDSVYIMDVLNRYFSSASSLDVSDLEKVLVDQLVHRATDYGAMNLVVYVKGLKKLLVLCSYNAKKVRSIPNARYYTLYLASDGKTWYVASETDHRRVVSGSRQEAKNHTLYVMDQKTGEMHAYFLSDLERAVDEVHYEAKRKEGEKKNAESSEQESKPAPREKTGKKIARAHCTKCAMASKASARRQGQKSGNKSGKASQGSAKKAA